MKTDFLTSLIKFIGINLAIATGYFVLGYAGALLATPPSHASPIWPAAGLALAAVLVCGKQVVPGLFLGALAINTHTYLEISSPELLSSSFITLLIISLGSCIQAIVGANLVDYFLGKNNPLIEDSTIIRFFLFGALFSCLIGSTIGISIIFFQDFIITEDILISWATWWVGDSIGVIIFTPIILSFVAKPRLLWQERKKLVSYPLLFTFVLVVSIFQYNQNQETARITSTFERQVSKFHSFFNNEILHHVEVNQVLKSFYDNSEYITSKEFHGFTQPILNERFDTQALEWISFITAKQRSQFEKRKIDGLIIRELNQQKQMISAGERGEYYPITYVQPLVSNERALGFDVGVNPTALKALVEARDTGRTVITDPVQLVQDLEKKTGFVLYSPVYQKNKSITSIDSRKKALKGFVAGVFRMEDEIKKVFSSFPDVQLLLEIEGQNSKLYGDFPDKKPAAFNLFSLQQKKLIHVANHVWTVIYKPTENFYYSHLSSSIWWIFLSGLIITSFMSIALLILSGRTLRTEELVRVRTQDLSESEKRFKQSQNFANVGTWEWNIKTGKVYWSEKVPFLLGYGTSNILANYKNFLAALHPDDIKKVKSVIQKSINEKCKFETQYRIIWPDKSIHWIHEKGAVIYNENEEASLIRAIISDITEIKEVEEELRRLQQKAEEANKAKSQFLSNMSHELRTPLNAILGFSQLMQVDIKKNHPALSQHIDIISKAGTHLLQLVDDILDLTIIEAGKMNLSLEPVDMKLVIEDCFKLLSTLAKDNEISLRTEINFQDDSLPEREEIVVIADKRRIEQVLLNLITNAIKYNIKKGSVIVICKQTENNMIRITVKDTGRGLNIHQQDKIFTIFERLGVEKEAIQGTGIGLFVTKQLIKEMNGFINFKSQVGLGSQFWIELPKSQFSGNFINEKVETTILPYQNSQKTVLYIEDDQYNQMLMKEIFKAVFPSYQLIMATKPRIGLSMANEQQPDLILLDLTLPDMDGYEVNRQLKQSKFTRHIPVIAVSANAMITDVNQSKAAGFVDYITKPIDIDLLTQNINRILSEHN